MELNASYDIECSCSMQRIQHELWPLDPIDPKNTKFPCCVVWTPLPVVSWLAPFIGHVGICREDGVVLDFSGSNFVNVDDFAFGAVARYLQLDRNQVMSLKLPHIDIVRKITNRTNFDNNNNNVLLGNNLPFEAGGLLESENPEDISHINPRVEDFTVEFKA